MCKPCPRRRTRGRRNARPGTDKPSVERRFRAPFLQTPQSASADSIPQFAMVAPLRSQVRLRLSLAHWAYFALLRAQRARFVRPLGLKGSLLDSATTAGSCPAKSLLFPEGKRGARRPPPVAETGRSKPSETGNIASALCARSEATMLNCGTVARRKPRRRDRQIQSLIYFRAKVRQFPLAFPQKIW